MKYKRKYPLKYIPHVQKLLDEEYRQLGFEDDELPILFVGENCENNKKDISLPPENNIINRED